MSRKKLTNMKIYKRGISFALAFAMTFTSLGSDVSNMTAYADEENQLKDYTLTASVGTSGAGEKTSLVITKPLDTASEAELDGILEVPYGSKLNFEVEDGDANTFTYFAKERNKEDAEDLNPNSVKLDNGYYYVFFTEDNDTYGGSLALENGVFKDRVYAIHVTKATVSDPTNMRWENGSVAKWDAVTTSTDGATLEAGVIAGYEIELIQNTTSSSKIVKKETVTKTEVDYTSIMLANGEGKYLLHITPVLSEAAKTSNHYTLRSDVVENPSSTVDAYVVSAAVSGDKGVSSVKIAVGENAATDILTTDKTTALLIANNSVYGSGYVKASVDSTVVEGHLAWTFNHWSSSGEITFAQSDSLTSKFTLRAYSGNDGLGTPLSLSLVANTTDEIAPVIESFEIGTGSNDGKMVATAKDEQGGLGAYAFTQKSDEESLIESDWQIIPAATNLLQTFTKDVNTCEAGTYYFYVRDVEGHVTKAPNSIVVTKVVYHDFYVKGDALSQEFTRYHMGLEEYEIEKPARNGYRFEGWFEDPDKLANEILPNEEKKYIISDTELGKTHEIYAKWDQPSLNVSIESSEADSSTVNRTYTGLYSQLRAVIDNPEYEEYPKSYQWYKWDGSEWALIGGATTAYYNVTTVADSGKYRVVAKAILSETTKPEGTSAEFEVTINRKELLIVPDAKSVFYGDDKPASFSYKITGYVNSEDATIAGVTKTASYAVTCAYEKWSDVGEYQIYVTGLSAANYSFALQTVKLKVEKKDVTDNDDILLGLFKNEGLTEAVDNTTYTYAPGSPAKPFVKVVDSAHSSDPISSAEYEVTYTNNSTVSTNVKRALVTVNFENSTNYTGVLTKEFIINKAIVDEPEFTFDGWTYGDGKTHTPVITQVDELAQEAQMVCTYYNADKSVSYGEHQPSDAGDYVVSVKMQGANVESRSAEKSFTIAKRKVTLKSGSISTTYDGNAHTSPDVEVVVDVSDIKGVGATQNTLMGTDAFLSVSATGSIRQEGTVTNTIVYTFTTSTNAENYAITKNEGTLSIGSNELTAPSNIRWLQTYSTPGRLAWVDVIKDGLNAKYRVSLYRVYEDSQDEIQYQLVKIDGNNYIDTTNNYVDLKQAIKADLEAAQETFAYTATVQTIPVYNPGDPQNFSASATSEKGETLLYTTKVTVKFDESHIESAKVGATTVANNDVMYLLPGEYYGLSVTTKKGFVVVDDEKSYTWTENSDNLYVYRGTDYYELNAYTFCTQNSTAVLTINSVDEAPSIVTFEATTKNPYATLTFRIEGHDSLEATHYALTTSKTTPSASEWIESDNGHSEYTGEKYLGYSLEQFESFDTDHDGKVLFYLHIKDSNNKVATSEPLEVYEIKFVGGSFGETSAVGTMPSVLKVQNEEITLPANTFTCSGYGFKNWMGKTGQYYEDQAKYAKNEAVTMTGIWTDEAYEYQVRYHVKGLDGLFETETKSFYAKYGVEVDLTSEEIAPERTGFLLDHTRTTITTTISGESSTETDTSFTMEGHTVVADVYYMRKHYSFAYKYEMTKADGTVETGLIGSVHSILYEDTDLPEEPDVASLYPGYEVSSWLYDHSGMRPSEMPAHEVEVVVTLTPKSTTYVARYFFEILDDDGNVIGYETVPSYKTEDTYASVHGKEVSINVSGAPKVEGCTAAYVYATNGSSEVADFDEGVLKLNGNAVGTTCTGTVDSDESAKLYINYCYKRNSYRIILNVYKGDRSGDPIYTTANLADQSAFTFKYGQKINNPSFFERYAWDTEADSSWLTNASVGNYVLAEYKDWSTHAGEAPTIMPASDISVSRDYVISEADSIYNVEVYLENDEVAHNDASDYRLATTLSYRAVPGSRVRIKSNSIVTSAEDIVLNYTTFKGVDDYFDYYTFVGTSTDCNEVGISSSLGTDRRDKYAGAYSDNKLYGVVNADGSTTLRIYFERKIVQTKINYYINDSTRTGKDASVLMCTVVKSGKWSEKSAVSNYNFEPTALFDGDFTESAGTYTANGGNAVWTDIVGSPAWTTTGEALVKTSPVNFRDEEYIVKYSGYYNLKNDGHWPNATYTTNQASGATDLTNGTKTTLFGMTTSNRMDVYYVKPLRATNYHVDYTYVNNGLHKKLGDEQITSDTTNSNNKTNLTLTLDELSNTSAAQSANAAIIAGYDGETKFSIRVVNEKEIYATNYVAKDGVTIVDYPGAYYIDANVVPSADRTKVLEAFGTRVTTLAECEATPNTTYTVLNVNGQDHFVKYIKAAGAETGKFYVYMINTANTFYHGNGWSWSYSTNKASDKVGELAYKKIQKYLSDYRALEELEETDEKYDGAASTVYLSNGGTSGVNMTGNTETSTTYSYGVTYRITYVLNGQYDYSGYYAPNKTVSVGTDKWNANAGYKIVWFMDSNFNTVAEKTLKLDRNYTLYGQAVKAEYTNHSYAYYELANAYLYKGAKVKYITPAMILEDEENAKAAAALGTDYEPVFAKSVQTKTISFKTGYNKTESRDIVMTTYTYKGDIVLVDVSWPALAFSTVAIKDAPKETLSAKFVDIEGVAQNSVYKVFEANAAAKHYHLDNKQADARANAYILENPVELKVFFARDQYILSYEGGDELAYSHGETVTLKSGATKIGYTFGGYKVLVYNESTGEWDAKSRAELAALLNTTVVEGEDGSVYLPATDLDFEMPAVDLMVEKYWIPAELSGISIMHYFQDGNGKYRTDVILSEYTEATSVKVGGNAISAGTAYYSAPSKTKATLIGVSVTTGGNTYYYAAGASNVQDSYIEVADADIIAISEAISGAKSEDLLVLGDHKQVISGCETVFDFTRATYKTSDSSETMTADEATFVVVDGMTIDYYYARENGYALSVIPYASDANAATGMTILGEGTNYFFNEEVTLTVKMSDGYTFKGWYAYDSDAEDATGYEEKTPLSEIATFTVNITDKDTKYVAISVPDEVKKPSSSSIAGPVRSEGAESGEGESFSVFHYGYSYDTDHAMTVTLANLDSKTKVTGYQWFEYKDSAWVEITGATALTYIIATGKTAGNYRYRCDVTLKNADNGRSITLTTDEYEIRVRKNALPIEFKDRVYTYSGAYLTFGIDTKLRYSGADSQIEIYYSDKEMSLDGDGNVISATGGSTPTRVKPYEKDVKGIVEEAKGEAYVYYYYVKDLTGNYADATGSVSLTINPKELTVTAGTSTAHSKVYDGSNQIVGDDIMDTTSEKYDIASGDFFKITGIVAADTDKFETETRVMILDFDAEYNDSHVDLTNSIRLSNMKIVTYTRSLGGEIVDAQVNHNYYIKQTDSVVLPGFITARPIEIAWSDTEFTYDNVTHKPTATVTDTFASGRGVSILVGNEQSSAGVYTATASIKTDASKDRSSDYCVATTGGSADTCEYEIKKVAITIAPISKTGTDYIYNGTRRSLTTFYITSEDGDYTSATEGTLEATAPSFWKEFTAKTELESGTAGTYPTKDAGVVSVQIVDGSVKIYDKNNKLITDNYDITCETATMEIAKKAITVTGGIKAEDKAYDATKTASLDATDASSVKGNLAGVEANEEVYILLGQTSASGEIKKTDKVKPGDTVYLTGAFENENAGTGKTVTITYDGEIKLGGADAKNYVLDAEHSIKTTTADIKAGEIVLSLNPVEVVYGEKMESPLVFTRITRIKNVENREIVAFTADEMAAEFSGEVEYTLTQRRLKASGDGYEEVTLPLFTDENKEFSSENDIHAGDYYLYVSIGSFTASNYVVTIDESARASVAVLPRKISIADGTTPTKEYDKTTAVPSGFANASNEVAKKYVTLVNSEGYTGNGGAALAAGDTFAGVGIRYATASYNSENVGSATHILMTGISATSPDYELITTDGQVSVDAEITKRPVTITAQNKSTTYGQDAPAFTVTYGNKSLPSGEDANAVFRALYEISCDYTNVDGAATSHAGEYAITVARKSSAVDPENYTVSFAAGKLTVKKKAAKVIAENKIGAYGYAPSGWTVRYEGAEHSDDLASLIDAETEVAYKFNYSKYPDGTAVTDSKLTGTVTSLSATNAAGTYIITPEVTATLQDYTFTSQTGTYTVSVSPFTVTVTDINGKVYDSKTTINAKDVTVCISELFPDDLSYFKSQIFTTGKGYTQVDEKTFTKDGLTYIVDSEAKSITVPASFASTQGLIVTANYVDANAGNDKPINCSLSLSGNYLGMRYALKDEDKTQSTLTADIAKCPLKLTIKPADAKVLYGKELTYNCTWTAWDGTQGLRGSDAILVNGKAATTVKASLKDAASIPALTGAVTGQIIYETNYLNTAEDWKETSTYFVRGVIEDESHVAYLTSDNYIISVNELDAVEFSNTDFAVTANKLTAPVVSWVADTLANATWTKPAKIGMIDVDSYEIRLLKGTANPQPVIFTSDFAYYDHIKAGSGDTVFVISQAEYEALNGEGINFESVIRGNETGDYKVEVKAVPETEGNAGQKNVTTSAAGTTTAKAAAKVNLLYTIPADTLPNGNVVNIEQSIHVGEAEYKSPSAYVMIAGETTVDLVTAMTGAATAYAVNAYSATLHGTTTKYAGLSIGTNSESYDGTTVEESVTATWSKVEAKEIDVTLKLKLRPATVTATIAANNKTFTYGYDESSCPIITVNSAPLASDKNSGYTYTYEWSYVKGQEMSKFGTTVELKELGAPATTVEIGTLADGSTTNVSVLTMPEGLTVSKGSNAHFVRCVVTATRNDNGQQAVYKYSSSNSTFQASFQVVAIKPENAEPVVKNAGGNTPYTGWMYGEERVLAKSNVNPEGASETVKYRKNGEDDTKWTTTIPKNVGHYDIKVEIAESDNYAAYSTQVRDFWITQNQFAEPENLEFVAGASRPYGVATWTKVSDIKENAGIANASDSTAVAQYLVTLYRDGTNKVKEVTVAGNSYDFGADITVDGTYTFTVKAVAVGTFDQSNVADSAEVTSPVEISVGHFITATTTYPTYPLGETTPTTSWDSSAAEYKKVYDGAPIVLSVPEEAGATYKWSKTVVIDGVTSLVEIEGATEATYSVTNVNDSALYSCEIDSPSGLTFAASRTATITSRSVTLQAKDATSVYASAEADVSSKVDITNPSESYVVVDALAYAGESEYDHILVDNSDLGTIGIDLSMVISDASTSTYADVATYADVLAPTYDETATNVANGNYTVAVETADYIVTKATLEVAENTSKELTMNAEANPQTYTYDGDAHTILMHANPANIKDAGFAGTDTKVYFGATAFAGTPEELTGMTPVHFAADGTITVPAEFQYTNVNWDDMAKTELVYTVYYRIVSKNYNDVIGCSTVLIEQLEINVTSSDKVFTYNGTAQKSDSISDLAVDAATPLVSGDELNTVVFNNSVTDVAETAASPVANEFSALTIKDAADGNADVTNNYKVNPTYGEMVVAPATPVISILKNPIGKIYDGAAIVEPADDPAEISHPDDYGTDVSYEITYQYAKYDGTSYVAMGEIPTEAGDYQITATVTPVASGDGVSNYTAATSAAVGFTIDKRAIVITSADKVWDYDGAAHQSELSDLSVTSTTQLADDEAIISASFANSATNVKDSTAITATNDNSFSDVVIMHGTGADAVDVTDNYAIVPVAGTLTVNPVDPVVSIEKDLSKVYDSTKVDDPLDQADELARPTDYNADVTVTYSYYTFDGVSYTLLSEAPVNAGVYYVRAFVDGDTNANYNDKLTDYKQFIISKATLGTDLYEVTPYSEAYDSQAHGIDLSVDASVAGQQVYYSRIPFDETNDLATQLLNGTAASDATYNSYTDAYASNSYSNQAATTVNGIGAMEYTVYYYITSDNYNDVAGTSTVTIRKEEVEFTGIDESSIHSKEEVKTVYSKVTKGKIYNDELATSVALASDGITKLYPAKAWNPETDQLLTKDDHIMIYRDIDEDGDGIVDKDGGVVPTVALLSPASGNYAVTFKCGAYTISDKYVGIEATPYSDVYDGNAHTATLTVVDLDGNDYDVDKDFNIEEDASTKVPYHIYYSTTSELTLETIEDEYAAGNVTSDANIPMFTDAGVYTIYYLLFVPNPNYDANNPHPGEPATKFEIIHDYVTVTIAKEPQVIDLTTATKNQGTYDAVTKELTVTYKGSAFDITGISNKTSTAADDGILSYTYTRVEDEKGNAVNETVAAEDLVNVGTYEITINSAEGTNTLAAAELKVKLIIAPRAIEISANAAHSTYRNPLATLSYTVTSGTICSTADETALGIQVGVQTISSASAAGTYTDEIIVDYDHTSAVADNYTITCKSADYTIDARAITVKSRDKSFVYDGLSHKLDDAVTVIEDGASVSQISCVAGTLATGDYFDAITFTTSVTEVSDNAAGNNTYSSLVIKNSDGVDVTSNYAITNQQGSVTITPANPVITLDSLSRDYNSVEITNADVDAKLHIPTDYNGSMTTSYTFYTKDANGQYVELSSHPKDAGTYYVSITVTAGADANYKTKALNYQQFEINKKAVTITANSAHSVYGEAIASLSAAVTSGTIHHNELGTIGAAIVSGISITNAGTYADAIEPTYTANDNYAVTVVNADYTVDKASQVLQFEVDPAWANDAEITWDAATKTLTVMYYNNRRYTVPGTVVIGDGALSVLYTKVKNGAGAAITPEAVDNSVALGVKDAGTYEVVLHADETINYLEGTLSGVTIVVKRHSAVSIKDAIVDDVVSQNDPKARNAEKIYDGEAIEVPEVHAEVDGQITYTYKLIKDENGRPVSGQPVTTDEPTDAGTYEVGIVIPASDNNDSSIGLTTEVIIKKANPKPIASDLEKEYSGEYHSPNEVDVTNAQDSQVKVYYSKVSLTKAQWQAEIADLANSTLISESIPEYENAGVYVVYYFVDGGRNYESSRGTTTLTIKPQKAEIEVLGEEVVYDKNNHSGSYTIVSTSDSLTTLANAQCKVYFSTEPIDASNLETVKNTAGSDQMPVYSEAGTYPVYYAIECETGNYAISDKAVPEEMTSWVNMSYGASSSEILYGSTMIKISPIVVQLTWSASRFLYDGTSKKVTAEITNAKEEDEVSIGTYAENVKTADDKYVASALTLVGENAANYTLVGANKTHNWVITNQMTNAEAKEIANQLGVDEDTVKITDDTVLNTKTDGDFKGSTFSKLRAYIVDYRQNQMTLRWTAVTGADGYIVYGNRCNSGGKKYNYEHIKTDSAKKTYFVLKNLDKARYYKFVVRAYKIVKGKRITIATSKTVHGVTTGGKYGIAKAVKLLSVGKQKTKLNTVTIKVGQTAAIKAAEVRKDKPISHHRDICYESWNAKICYVSAKGVIKGMKKGTTYIYVYAQNGAYQRIKVTVK